MMWEMRLLLVSFWGINWDVFQREHNLALDTAVIHDSHWHTVFDKRECRFVLNIN